MTAGPTVPPLLKHLALAPSPQHRNLTCDPHERGRGRCGGECSAKMRHWSAHLTATLFPCPDKNNCCPGPIFGRSQPKKETHIDCPEVAHLRLMDTSEISGGTLLHKRNSAKKLKVTLHAKGAIYAFKMRPFQSSAAKKNLYFNPLGILLVGRKF